ncbi:hypothetical protein CEXT_173991 [Caerostris extrusa]|uniref:Uncharacterized protein n=1 Tax=Caerostris extrusa TaxID=172846 RepID=A0AAV4R681_CAEEX|nr:hypothetical protein CEXT_173991 [Caerostris extrusa]
MGNPNVNRRLSAPFKSLCHLDVGNVKKAFSRKQKECFEGEGAAYQKNPIPRNAQKGEKESPDSGPLVLVKAASLTVIDTSMYRRRDSSWVLRGQVFRAGQGRKYLASLKPWH